MTKVDIILKNGTLVVPTSTNSSDLIEVKSDLAVLNKKIFAIGPSSKWESEIIHDMTGLHILPGVIDSQVHFREPGLTHKEDLESGTRAALLGGVTSIFEMPNTNPSTTTIEQLQDKISRAKNRAHCHFAFYIGAAVENIYQLAELEKSDHCAGVKIFMGSSTGQLLIDNEDVLEKILANGHRRVIIHAEDEERLKQRKHLAEESHDVCMHPIWRDEETALLATKKAVKIARKTNRPLHILHVSTAEEMDYLKNHKDIVTIEVLPQHLTFAAPECYEKWGTLLQQNPPIRSARHREALWKGISEGLVDVIGSDHAPHTLEEKNKIYPATPSGIPGVQTFIPAMLEHIHQGRLPFLKWVQMVTENPRRIFGLINKGRLEIGYDADFTILDLKKEMTIDNSMMASKSNWTPFHGMKVHGWAVAAYLNGELVMKDGLILKPSLGQALNFKN